MGFAHTGDACPKVDCPMANRHKSTQEHHISALRRSHVRKCTKINILTERSPFQQLIKIESAFFYFLLAGRKLRSNPRPMKPPLFPICRSSLQPQNRTPYARWPLEHLKRYMIYRLDYHRSTITATMSRPFLATAIRIHVLRFG